MVRNEFDSMPFNKVSPLMLSTKVDMLKKFHPLLCVDHSKKSFRLSKHRYLYYSQPCLIDSMTQPYSIEKVTQ